MSVKHVWVICGGVSAEHEVSIVSARQVVKGLLEVDFTPHVVLIDRENRWHYLDNIPAFLDQATQVDELCAQAGRLSLAFGEESVWRLLDSPEMGLPCDVVFPMVHGQQGEDGVLQGVLRACDLPFVGADILGSSLCMSKLVAKQLLEQAGIATVPWIGVRDGVSEAPDYPTVSAQLGESVFVKPVSQGSSIGISRVTDASSYQKALVDAFCYDTEIIIEQAIIGREIECSVLGNQRPRVALPGEIVCHDGFYSYAAKYVSEDQASVEVPADLTPVQVDLIQRTALKVYRALYCQGMARVDVFLTADDIIYINEVNTIPGFTSISMYAQNWLASGLDMSALLMKLIHCAVDVHQQRKQIQTRNLLPLSINKYEFS